MAGEQSADTASCTLFPVIVDSSTRSPDYAIDARTDAGKGEPAFYNEVSRDGTELLAHETPGEETQAGLKPYFLINEHGNSHV